LSHLSTRDRSRKTKTTAKPAAERFAATAGGDGAVLTVAVVAMVAMLAVVTMLVVLMAVVNAEVEKEGSAGRTRVVILRRYRPQIRVAIVLALTPHPFTNLKFLEEGGVDGLDRVRQPNGVERLWSDPAERM
jgi:hypothetical protein